MAAVEAKAHGKKTLTELSRCVKAGPAAEVGLDISNTGGFTTTTSLSSTLKYLITLH